MTSLNNVPATIQYLTDSAHLLYASAPATSAHLLCQRRDLLVQQNIPVSQVHQQQVCGACGNIMLPDSDSVLKLEARRTARRATKKKKQTADKTHGPVKTIVCGRCHRSTKIELPTPGPPARQRKIKRSKTDEGLTRKSGDAAAPDPPKLTSNASSKKRAKSRKAGLQSLLSGQQQQQSRSLSLSDFMRK